MRLSGYRLMWMLVMFDLPVGTKPERSAATKFRNFLLDRGFQMSQFSVYMRMCAGKEQVDVHIKHIREALPETGKVHIFSITDRQYENLVCFDGRKREPANKTPDQYVMF